MKDKIDIFIYVLLIAGFFTCQFIDDSKNRSLQQQNSELRNQLAHASIYTPVDYRVINDTVLIATAPVQVVSAKSYKHDMADKKLLKEMGVKADRVTEQQTTDITYSDTVSLDQKRGEWCYHDAWVDFALSLQDTSMTYSIRDSVVSVIHRIPSHHFLFWHWGTKGYKVEIRNFNPHVKINHLQYVMIQ